jgi:hypothetical protein
MFIPVLVRTQLEKTSVDAVGSNLVTKPLGELVQV